MITKLFEAFFRHKLLLLLPLIIIPGIVTPIAWFLTPPSYDTTITVWIDHPAYLDYKDGSSPWITPAQTQSSRLTELLHTRSFVMDVAKRTSLAPLVGSTAGEARIDDLINRSFVLGRVGDHVLALQVQGPTAQLSYELDNAILNAFQEKNAADQADQASLAVSFYQSRVQDAEQQLAKTGQDMRRYVAAQTVNSDSSLSDQTGPSLAQQLDPRLSTLQANLVSAQADVTSARAAVAQAQYGASAALEGQQLGFQVLDPARMPTTATRAIKKLIVYPIAAVVVALALSALLLVVLVAGDRSVRQETDIVPAVRVLGVVPTWKLKRVPKRIGAVATRRAIGAPAGTALPIGAK